MQTMTALLWQQLRREWTLQLRQKKSWVNSLLFFAMIVLFFPMTLPADAHLDRMLAPGLVWVALLLSNLLAAERLFQVDYEEGVIELWQISGQPLTILIIAKVLVHWGVTLVPLLAGIPLVAGLFDLPRNAAVVLAESLGCGTLPIILLSALAAAYSTVLPQKGVLMGLIVLPLILPVLILGAGATAAAVAMLPVGAYLAYLGALSCVTLAGMPMAIAAVMRS